MQNTKIPILQMVITKNNKPLLQMTISNGIFMKAMELFKTLIIEPIDQTKDLELNDTEIEDFIGCIFTVCKELKISNIITDVGLN